MARGRPDFPMRADTLCFARHGSTQTAADDDMQRLRHADASCSTSRRRLRRYRVMMLLDARCRAWPADDGARDAQLITISFLFRYQTNDAPCYLLHYDAGIMLMSWA